MKVLCIINHLLVIALSAMTTQDTQTIKSQEETFHHLWTQMIGVHDLSHHQENCLKSRLAG